jgi:hypothetical protein
LGTYTAILSFFPRFKTTVGVIFLNAVEYHLRFPLDVGHYFKTLSLQFNFGKQIQLSSPVMFLEIKVGSLLAFCHSSRHKFARPLLLIICQELGNKLRGSAAHVQIFC